MKVFGIGCCNFNQLHIFVSCGNIWTWTTIVRLSCLKHHCTQELRSVCDDAMVRDNTLCRILVQDKPVVEGRGIIIKAREKTKKKKHSTQPPHAFQEKRQLLVTVHDKQQALLMGENRLNLPASTRG